VLARAKAWHRPLNPDLAAARVRLPGAEPNLAGEDRVEQSGGNGVRVSELGWDADGLRQLTEWGSPVRRRVWKLAGYRVGLASTHELKAKMATSAFAALLELAADAPRCRRVVALPECNQAGQLSVRERATLRVGNLIGTRLRWRAGEPRCGRECENQPTCSGVLRWS
jgi:hypothetical protein